MVEILTGLTRKGNTAEILKRISTSVNGKKAGNILIVPEQFSFDAELLLCRSCGATSGLYAEVLSFTRLAARTSDIYGGNAHKTLDAAGKYMTLVRAEEQIHSRLKLWSGAASRPELTAQLLKQLTEFKNYGVSASELKKAAAIFEGTFSQKLEELSLLVESYDAVCANGDGDPSDLLGRLTSHLRETDYAEGRTFYFDGFTDFTAPQQDVLKVLIQRGASLVFSFVCDEIYDGDNIYDTARKTIAWITGIASRTQGPVLFNKAESSKEDTLLPNAAFSYCSGQDAGEAKAVRIFCQKDIHEECSRTLGLVLTAVRNGARYRDIEIAAQPEYFEILHPMLDKYGIQTYYSETSVLVHEPMAEALLCAVEGVINSNDMELLLQWLKSAVSPLNYDQTDILENYVRMWNISGNKWFSDWKMSPFGYDKPGDSSQLLARLNEMRCIVAEPLKKLGEALRISTDITDQLDAVYSFMLNTGFDKNIETAAESKEISDARKHEIEQIYPSILHMMEQLNLALGDMKKTPAEFLRLLRQIFSLCELKTVPASVDSVLIGNIPALRYKVAPYLIVLGAGDGQLPSAQPSAGLLSDAEKRMLREQTELPEIPDENDRITRELSGIYDILSSGTAEVNFIYSGEPSYLVSRIQKKLSITVCREAVPEPLYSVDDAALLLAKSESSISPIYADTEAGKRAADMRKKSQYTAGFLSPRGLQVLYGDKLRLSASKIDTYGKCRFAYFLQYGLQLMEQKKAEIDPAIWGTLVHYVMEHVFGRLKKAENPKNLTSDALDRLIEEESRNFIKEKIPDYTDRNIRFQYLLERNLDEMRSIIHTAYDELNVSDFSPSYFELKFSEKGPMPPIEIKAASHCAEIVGSIDRVDTGIVNGSSYYRVIDYKTGKKAFEYTDIENGIGLQMLIYLFALQNAPVSLIPQNSKPAGVLYVLARNLIKSAEQRPKESDLAEMKRKSSKREGMLIDDENVLSAMEHKEQNFLYLPVSETRNGLKGNLATKDEMKLLEKHVYEMVRSMTDDVYSGNITANPYLRGVHNPCSYCSFLQICRKGTTSAEARSRTALKSDEFWRIMEERYHG